ncbi:hypothetical protein M0678_01325 [Mycobacterium colombiense]|nr:hypothetical protein [Mycobacterium colombiense]MCK8642408.1 hypothetical protein [Mycobacterium colombiense]
MTDSPDDKPTTSSIVVDTIQEYAFGKTDKTSCTQPNREDDPMTVLRAVERRKASDNWQPVLRIGVPTFVAGIGNRIKVEVKTKGWISRDWRRYFSFVIAQQQLDAKFSLYPCWDEIQRIEGTCTEDEVESYIVMIDAAIHHANNEFQRQALLRAVVHAPGRSSPSSVRERQLALDQLAQKLAKPEAGDRGQPWAAPDLVDHPYDGPSSSLGRQGGITA